MMKNLLLKPAAIALTSGTLICLGSNLVSADYNPYGSAVTPPNFGSLVVSQGANTGVTTGVAPTSGAPLVALGSPSTWQVLGTTFTLSGCSATSPVGSGSAGTFTSGTAGTCTVTVTINGASGAAAPNGWACSANDLTTTSDTVKQTASTATTATLSGTTASGDVINFSCTPY